jgi:nitrite reductase/ring-hydroxylating ferredoxin subunit
MTVPVSSSSTAALLWRIVSPLAPPFSRLQLIARHLSTTRPSRMTKTFKVAEVTELQDGQMKEVDIPGTEGKVLLSKVKGEFYATGAKCTRNALPLQSRRRELIGRLWCSVEEWGVDGERTTCLSMAWSDRSINRVPS